MDTDPKRAATSSTTLLNGIVEKYAPTICLKIREHAPGWLNGDFLAHVDEREFWGKKYNKCPCQFHLDKKLDSFQRTPNLKLELQKSFFKNAMDACGGDSKKK